MNHDCITSRQGREACTCSRLHTANSDDTSPYGDPWDWVDHVCDRIFMVLTAMAIVTVFTVAQRLFN